MSGRRIPPVRVCPGCGGHHRAWSESQACSGCRTDFDARENQAEGAAMAREARLERMRRRPLEHELRRLERLRAVAIEEGAFATPYFDRMIAAARHELEAPVVVNPAELDEASIGLGDIDAGDG